MIIRRTVLEVHLVPQVVQVVRVVPVVRVVQRAVQV
jgi:hypothetical protein